MSDKQKKLPLVLSEEPTSSADDPGAELDRLLSEESGGVIAALLKQVERCPGDEVTWLKLGGAYMSIEHWAQAAEALEEAVALDDTLIEARRMLARVLSKRRRFDEAVYQLLQARRVLPDDTEVARELGVAFYEKGLYDKALTEFKRARAVAVDDGRLCFSMGLAHEAKNAMAEAIASYREAVQLQPEFIEARMTLADALAAVGELAEAVAQLEMVLRQDRTNTQVAINLEALQKALTELRARRLLGKTEQELALSALLEGSGLARQTHADGDGGTETLMYRSDLAELIVTVSKEGRITQFDLLFPDPAQAAQASGEALQVTVVSEQGQPAPADYATAVALTLLREAVGCPMTRAGELYSQLLQTHEPVVWAGATIGFRSTDMAGERKHGLFVEASSPADAG